MTECYDDTQVTFTATPTSSNGRLTLSSIDQFAKDFEKSFVYTSESDNPINIMVAAYGETSFYNSVRELNSFLFNSDLNLEPYPNLKNRQQTNIILTPIEVAQFEIGYVYTPDFLVETIPSDRQKVLDELDAFYTESFTKSKIGSFCALAPAAFAAIDGFFDALDNLSSFINKIQNLSLSNLVGALKQQITNLFDQIIKTAKGIVENFKIENIVGGVEAFVNENVLIRARELKDAALSFFSEENINSIKKRISALITYVVNLFKNPTIDEIQFIIYRFCGLANQIENGISQIQKPLTDYASNYSSVYSTLSAASNQNTARAVKAGAIRYDTPTRKGNINNSRADYTAAGNPAPIAVGEIDGVTSWNNGSGDSRITFGNGLQPGKMGEEGWTRVDTTARVLLMRVQSKFGRRLTVTSGYRSPAYNASVDGATKSYHMSGKAIDVTWAGFNAATREDFIRLARQEGFGGIGRYNSFVHVDVGPEREWPR